MGHQYGLLICVFVLSVLSACNSRPVCNSPYIIKGDSCCLDIDDNRICDGDESVSAIPSVNTSSQPDEQVNIQNLSDVKTESNESFQCNLPYIHVGNNCCLDKNGNNICDADDSVKKKDIEVFLDGVVTITVVTNYKVTLSDGTEDFVKKEAQGSGFFISQDGYIITNDHVIENYMLCDLEDECEISGHMRDGSVQNLELVAFSVEWDIAILRSTNNKWKHPFLSLASSSGKIGDTVYVLGAPLGQEFTLTKGVISQKNRKSMRMETDSHYDRYLQTDAAINPGNSGGPIINEDGEVVGLASFGYLFFKGINYGLQSEEVLDFYNKIYPNVTRIRNSNKVNNFKSFDKNISITRGSANLFTRVENKKTEFTEFLLDIENKKDIPLHLCYQIRLIVNTGVLDYNETYPASDILNPHSRKSIKYNPMITYTSDWRHFYDISIFECQTNIEYGVIYGVGGYVEGSS